LALELETAFEGSGGSGNVSLAVRECLGFEKAM
jgi:hypothetical protein